MRVKIAQSNQEKESAFHVRKIVFVEEQHVPIELEMDDYDIEAIHFICQGEDKQTIGAGRLRFTDHYGKLERICILKAYRGKHFGEKIIRHMEETIMTNGYKKAKLNAQTHATSFYERLGYEVVSDEFMDAGIPHVTMIKHLS